MMDDSHDLSCSSPMVRICKLTLANTITSGARVVATKIPPTPIFVGPTVARAAPPERDSGKNKTAESDGEAGKKR